jgi:hypothetical protein
MDLRFGSGDFGFGGRDRIASALLAPLVATGCAQSSFPSYTALSSSYQLVSPYLVGIPSLSGF